MNTQSSLTIMTANKRTLRLTFEPALTPAHYSHLYALAVNSKVDRELLVTVLTAYAEKHDLAMTIDESGRSS